MNTQTHTENTHTVLTHSHAIFDQDSAVLLPACFAEGVLAGQCQQGVSPYDLQTHTTLEGLRGLKHTHTEIMNMLPNTNCTGEIIRNHDRLKKYINLLKPQICLIKQATDLNFAGSISSMNKN